MKQTLSSHASWLPLNYTSTWLHALNVYFFIARIIVLGSDITWSKPGTLHFKIPRKLRPWSYQQQPVSSFYVLQSLQRRVKPLLAEGVIASVVHYDKYFIFTNALLRYIQKAEFLFWGHGYEPLLCYKEYVVLCALCMFYYEHEVPISRLNQNVIAREVNVILSVLDAGDTNMRLWNTFTVDVLGCGSKTKKIEGWQRSRTLQERVNAISYKTRVSSAKNAKSTFHTWETTHTNLLERPAAITIGLHWPFDSHITSVKRFDKYTILPPSLHYVFEWKHSSVQLEINSFWITAKFVLKSILFSIQSELCLSKITKYPVQNQYPPNLVGPYLV